MRAVLHFCGVEASIDVWTAGGISLRRPLEGEAAARKDFLLHAVQFADLRKASARKGHGQLTSVDVQEARRVLQAVPHGAKQAALRSGDGQTLARTRR